MRLKKLPLYFLGAGFVLLITVGIFLLLPAQPVSAQCGSQASSCKNCHETQAKDPVNNDGTAWHTSHAFGDFCYLCHAGNNTATTETAAHVGLVDPLKDIAASCKSCHAADFQAKAQVYATTLGVTISSSAAAPTQAASQPAASTTPAAPVAPAAAPAVSSGSVPAADMVDYTQRYNESVLGQGPVNVGNVILIVMIAGMLFGGGYFVLRREGWVSVSFQDTKQIQPRFELVETMLYEPDRGYFLLEGHLRRLAESADYFDFRLDPTEVRERLMDLGGGLKRGAHRVRLRVDRQGRVTLESAPLSSGAGETPAPQITAGHGPWRLRLADRPITAGDVFLYHKTTCRGTYEAAFASRGDCDDVVLWNEQRQATETTIANLVVRKGGRLVTPPVACGLLPGVFRAHLLETGQIHEEIITLDDLRHAKQLFAVNSVRKWMPAVLEANA